MDASKSEADGEAGAYVEKSFQRDTNYLSARITPDGSDGWPVEPGRYRLVVSRACPWANRAIIVRRLLGLEEVLSMGVAGPTHDERSWTFDLDPVASTRCWGSRASRTRTRRPCPATHGESRCPRSSTCPPARS